MILYLDSSSLVKRYVSEARSQEVSDAISAAEAVATVVVTRAEISAALAKAVRMEALTPEEALASLQAFRQEWSDFVRVPATELVITRADTLAWEHGLRGYDAVHLSAASVWRDSMVEAVMLSTFDRRLWAAAKAIGLIVHPADLVEER